LKAFATRERSTGLGRGTRVKDVLDSSLIIHLKSCVPFQQAQTPIVIALAYSHFLANGASQL